MKMTRHSKGSSHRHGQVLVMAVFAVFVIGLVAALAIDVGYIMCTRARLQNAADAGSLAGALELVEQRNGGASESSARAAAEAEAQDIAAVNWGVARCEVLFGTYEDGEFEEQGPGTPASALQVNMYRDEGAAGGPLALFFAPIMGLDTVVVDAGAVSDVERGLSSVTAILAPFAVHEDDVPGAGEDFKFYLHDTIVPGCFGLLNLDGGSSGTPELRDWILDGYPGEIALDPETDCLWIEGTPGWRSALKSALQERLGDVIYICVYDEVEGQGSNANFRIIKFAAAELLDFKLTGNDKYIEGELERQVNVPFCEVGGPDLNLCKVQLVE